MRPRARVHPVVAPTAPFQGPFTARAVEGSARVWEVYSQAGGGIIVLRIDFTGLNVNARSTALWIAAAMTAKWSVEQATNRLETAYTGAGRK